MAAEKRYPQITLFRGWHDNGRYVWSPFPTKVEFRLRVAGVPYKTDAGSPRHAPKGKIPYVEVLNEGASTPTQIGDSALMIKYFIDTGVLPDLNVNLTASQKAQDMALRALLEDKFYFYNMRERWQGNYYVHRDKALWTIPYPMRVVVGLLVHRTVSATLHGQGTGRYSDAEVEAFQREIWQTIDGMLDEVESNCKERPEPYWCLGGRAPTEADAVLFGFITSALVAESGPKAKAVVQSMPAVMDYASRIHDKYFPDYEKWR